MRSAICLAILALVTPALAQDTGTLSGVVTDAETGEALIGANVFVPEVHRGAATDLDGRYTILGVPVGTYTVLVSYVGYDPSEAEGIEVSAGRTSTLDAALEVRSWGPCALACCGYVGPPLVSASVYAPRTVFGRTDTDLCCSAGNIGLDALPTGR